jgi:glycosyltransferase involved in cell wall biosynthesis
LFFACRLIRRILDIVRINEIQLLHTHSEIIGAALLLCRKRLRIPLVYTLHNPAWENLGFPLKDRVLGYPLEALIFKRYDAVIALNERIRDNILMKTRRQGPLWVIPNGIDTDLFQPFEKSAVTQEVNVLCVGQILRRKNQALLLEAVSHIQDKISQVLILGQVGEASYFRKVQESICSWGLKGKVTFLPYVDNEAMPSIYGKTTLFVHPSKSEASSLAVLEAMSCGCCVIASDIPSHRALIHSGENGLLFDPADAQDLRQKMEFALSNHDSRRRLERNARNHILRERSWKAIAGRYLSLYEALLD